MKRIVYILLVLTLLLATLATPSLASEGAPYESGAYTALDYGEEDVYDDNEPLILFSAGEAKLLFWVIFIVLGFGLPIAPLVVGICFSRNKRFGRHWIILSYAACAWLAIVALITVILLAF